MSHAEFVAAYSSGAIRVRVDRKRAAQHVSQRLLLPFLLLPFLGTAVALALTGRFVLGVAVFALVMVFRFVVRSSSEGFVLSRALQNAAFYEDARAAGLLSIE